MRQRPAPSKREWLRGGDQGSSGFSTFAGRWLARFRCIITVLSWQFYPLVLDHAPCNPADIGKSVGVPGTIAIHTMHSYLRAHLPLPRGLILYNEAGRRSGGGEVFQVQNAITCPSTGLPRQTEPWHPCLRHRYNHLPRQPELHLPVP